MNSRSIQGKLPAVAGMSGGYGEKISDTVEIHCNTIRAARSIFEPERDEQDNGKLAQTY